MNNELNLYVLFLEEALRAAATGDLQHAEAFVAGRALGIKSPPLQKLVYGGTRRRVDLYSHGNAFDSVSPNTKSILTEIRISGPEFFSFDMHLKHTQSGEFTDLVDSWPCRELAVLDFATPMSWNDQISVSVMYSSDAYDDHDPPTQSKVVIDYKWIELPE